MRSKADCLFCGFVFGKQSGSDVKGVGVYHQSANGRVRGKKTRGFISKHQASSFGTYLSQSPFSSSSSLILYARSKWSILYTNGNAKQKILVSIDKGISGPDIPR